MPPAKLREDIPLIVSGAPRSGTSLLYNLFDGHPEIAWFVGEGYLFEHLYDVGDEGVPLSCEMLRWPIEDLIAGLRDRELMPKVHEPWVQGVDLGSAVEFEVPIPWNESEFVSALSERCACDARELWRTLAAAWRAGLGLEARRFACMKAPDFGKSAITATRLLPESKAVVIIREPILALDSHKRGRDLTGRRRRSWPSFVASIRAFHHLAERLEIADPKRVHWLRYEDLAADPERMMRRLAAWLGIGYDACLTRPTMMGAPWPGVSSFGPTHGIDARPVEGPVRALTRHEVEFAMRHLDDVRRRFGYTSRFETLNTRAKTP